MWTRPLLKTNAKKILSMRYWNCFAACLIFSLLSGGAQLFTNAVLHLNVISEALFRAGFRFPMASLPLPGTLPLPDEFFYYASPEYAELFGVLTAASVVILIAALIAMLIGTLFSAFIGSPLKVGMCRYMMENRYSTSPLDTLFSTFRTPYMNVVKGMFFTHLRVFLWSLLFVIPGIYKSLQYSMVPYLLAENPYLTPARARELSRAMTDGEKMNILILHLSFIGWYIVAGLAGSLVTLGMLPTVGSVFLAPYVEGTFAELYAALRAKVFALDLTGEDELAGFVRH